MSSYPTRRLISLIETGSEAFKELKKRVNQVFEQKQIAELYKTEEESLKIENGFLIFEWSGTTKLEKYKEAFPGTIIGQGVKIRGLVSNDSDEIATHTSRPVYIPLKHFTEDDPNPTSNDNTVASETNNAASNVVNAS